MMMRTVGVAVVVAVVLGTVVEVTENGVEDGDLY